MPGKKHIGARTLNFALTDRALEMLDFVRESLGAASRSEAIRYLIRDKYEQLSSTQDAVGIATQQQRPFSLRGITDGNELTDEDFEEAKAIWEME